MLCSLVHVIQFSLDGGCWDLDLVHGVVITLGHDVGVDHVVARHVELGRVVDLGLSPREARVGVAVIEARGFVWSLELVVSVGQAVSVGGQPQTQLVGRDRQLTNEKRVLGALTNQRTIKGI